jgi:hypothetical protein
MQRMVTDMATRRTVLAGLLASGLPRVGWAQVGQPAFLAAARDRDGRCWLHGISAAGESLFRQPLPARGHAAAAHPERAEAVAFARRPGHFAFVLDCASGETRVRLEPPSGRMFNGHGAFSVDGRWLYTSEVVGETSEGRLGIWDAGRGYARLGEVATGGLGPHDVKRLPDGSLVVANGGLRTDPEDRTNLNVETMEPSLVYLSPEGVITDQVRLAPDLHQNSIRHLAMAPDGTVAFAMQWEGDPAVAVPLLGLHRRGGQVSLCPPPEAEGLAMRGYAGSIALDPVRGIAVTSSHGGVVMLFGLDGTWAATHRRQDVSGVAAGPEGFVVTDGLGVVSRCDALGLSPLGRAEVAWDNHLIAL